VNFKEIRDEINSSLDYNPDLAQYRDSVSRVVNRHYLQISSQYQWLFLQKSSTLTFEPTITGSATNTISVDDAVDGRRTVVFSGSTPSESWEGQTLTIGSTEYEITRKIAANKVLIDGTLGGDITSAPSESDWKLEFRRYKLPEDLVDILGIVSRADDRGRLLYIDRRKEEEHYLDRDSTGDPSAVIEDDHIIDPPPDGAPTLALKATTGPGLDPNTEYEFCYTFKYKGRESAPSLTSSITTLPGQQTIRVSGTDDTRATYGAVPSAGSTGRVKRVYARKKGSGGVWRLITDNMLEAPFVFSDWSGGFSGSGVESERFAVRNLFEQGPRQYLRAWYTADSTMVVDLRYMSRPRRLSNDGEYPLWPPQYHQLLVYRALQDICLQHGMAQMGQLYAQRAAASLEQMKARHLSRSDRMWVRQGFDKGLSQRERWGVPSKL